MRFLAWRGNNAFLTGRQPSSKPGQLRIQIGLLGATSDRHQIAIQTTFFLFFFLFASLTFPELMSQRSISTFAGFDNRETGNSLTPVEALAAAAAQPANSAAAAADVGTSVPHKFFLPTKKTEEFVVVPPGAGISWPPESCR